MSQIRDSSNGHSLWVDKLVPPYEGALLGSKQQWWMDVCRDRSNSPKHHVISFPLLWTKLRRQPRGRFILYMASEDSVPGWLPPRQKYRGGRAWWRMLLTRWQSGRGENKKDLKKRCVLQKHTPSDLLPPKAPPRNSPSNYELINGLIHWWG